MHRRDADVDRSHRFLAAFVGGSSDARNGDGEVCIRSLEGAFGHHDGNLSRNGSLGRKFLFVHAQFSDLGFVGVGDPGFLEPRTRTCDVGEGAGQQAARAGLCQRQRIFAFLEPTNQFSGCGLDIGIH